MPRKAKPSRERQEQHLSDCAGVTVSTSAAAGLLGIGSRWIQLLAKDGWFQAAGRGRWNLADLVQGYVGFLREDNARTAKSDSEGRLKEARSKEVELRTARLDRTVIDLSEALGAIDDVAGAYLESIAGLPARITRNPIERQRVQGICDAERQRIADRFGRISAAVRSGGSAAAAAGADDA